MLSVPTEYQEPKGIYVLEALANGIPVVVPRHGAFPELIDATGGGLLVEPGNAPALAAQLADLLVNSSARLQFGAQGRAVVHARYHPQALATQTLQLFQAARQAKSL